MPILQDFTDLDVWKYSHELVIGIYRVTQKFPKEELFCLTNQMRRSAISITSNIAEGFGRKGYKEKINFYYISKGSLTELKNQLIISKELKYINNLEFDKLDGQLEKSKKILQGLINKTKTFF